MHRLWFFLLSDKPQFFFLSNDANINLNANSEMIITY